MLAMLSYTQKIWAVGLKPLIQQMNFYHSRLCVEMPSIVHNGAIAYSCYKFIKVLSTEFWWHV